MNAQAWGHGSESVPCMNLGSDGCDALWRPQSLAHTAGT
jgi:hypothetical protein